MRMGDQRHAQAALPPGMSAGTYRRDWVGSRGRSGGFWRRKTISSLSGFEPPDSAARSESLTDYSLPRVHTILHTQAV